MSAPPAPPITGARALAWLRVPGTPDDAQGFTAEVLRGAGRIWKEQRRVLAVAFGGTSMEPAIRAGEPVQLVCGEACAAGDVIAFVQRDQVVVHRVLALGRGGWLLTCGDARTIPDLPIASRDDVIGRIATVTRDGVAAPIAAVSLSLRRRLVRLGFLILVPFGVVTVARAVGLARRMAALG